MEKENIFSKIPAELPQELFEKIVDQGSFTLERIVSKAHATPAGEWYDQEKNEWVILLKGAAGLRIAGSDDLVVLAPGDYVFLPAHCKHRVEWTASDRETIWLALHY
ncbi:MAG: cupin domain-containing protein [Proteobacteria bacterium]|nr:cupin domain-containing protein [Pseudomonadota bacterium]MBU4294480.1 cupin domain-containing protein [Pseudomonadota bacterium]MCG2749187.1 cupin domain-containing protein [Desulfobulbaceae bacterium]